MTASDLSQAVPIRPVPKPDGWTTDAEIGTVLIGTPCYGGLVSARYTSSLLGTMRELDRRGIPNGWLTTESESLIQRARNLIAAQFLAEPTTTHLIFIDADIEWEPADIIRLLAHDVDVIGGIYPKKHIRTAAEMSEREVVSQIAHLSAVLDAKRAGRAMPPEPPHQADFPLHFVADERGMARRDPRTGRVEIAHAPTGFLCIKRECFQRMIASGQVAKIEAMASVRDEVLPWLYDFFWTGVEDGILWSEDYGFCRRWRGMGGQVWCDPAIKLTHMGMHAYRGDPAILFSLPEAAGVAA